MKVFLPTLAAVALLAGAASVAFAQMPPSNPPIHPSTKVYAYKKTAPPKATSTPNANNSSSEHLIGSVPHGTLRWWEMIDRTGPGSE
jgi:hypothetical protein